MGAENCEGHARLLSSGKLQICTKNKITTKYIAATLESVQDILSKPAITPHTYQCWTEGRSSTAVAEGLGPTATVAKVLGHSYGQRFLLVIFLSSSEMKAEMCFSLHMCHLRLMWIMIVLSLKIKTGPFLMIFL